jgi:hypothetical protein
VPGQTETATTGFSTKKQFSHCRLYTSSSACPTRVTRSSNSSAPFARQQPSPPDMRAAGCESCKLTRRTTVLFDSREEKDKDEDEERRGDEEGLAANINLHPALPLRHRSQCLSGKGQRIGFSVESRCICQQWGCLPRLPQLLWPCPPCALGLGHDRPADENGSRSGGLCLN